MMTADYRLLIDALSDAYASLRSSRREHMAAEAACVLRIRLAQREAMAAEVANASERVRRSARDLMAAECPRAKQYDRDRAERLIDQTAKYLIDAGL